MNRSAPGKGPKSVRHNDSSSRRIDSLSAATSGDMHDSQRSWEQASDRSSDKSGGSTRKPPAADDSSDYPVAMGMEEAKVSRTQPSETDPLSVGYHPFNTLQGVHLPGYVKEHNATLTFPEKVRL